MKTSVLWLIVALFLCGCGSKSELSGSPPPAVTATATAMGQTAASASPASRAAEPPSPKEAVELALKTLNAWQAAQNGNVLADYLALYDPAAFRGVTRTTSGSVQKLSFADWKEQRSRTFGPKLSVAADAAKTVTWAENPGLGPGVVEIRFTQRWTNGKYADHGPKVMHVRVDKGVAKIIYEELLSTEPGWALGDPVQCADRPNSETGCELADGRTGWCSGGVCKDVCPAGHSYSADDARCHQSRDCKTDQEHDDWTTIRKTARCNHCIGWHCMDESATRNLINQD